MSESYTSLNGSAEVLQRNDGSFAVTFQTSEISDEAIEIVFHALLRKLLLQRRVAAEKLTQQQAQWREEAEIERKRLDAAK